MSWSFLNLILLWRRSLSYRLQSIDLHFKSMVYFLYGSNLKELKSSSHLQKMCYLLDWKPFKNDKKMLFISLERLFSFSRFFSQVFVTTFWSWRRNGLIRKVRLTSKFTMPQLGLQTIVIHTLPNISHATRQWNLVN